MSETSPTDNLNQNYRQNTELLKSPTYRGRFAPSPTGHLHIGSLIGALASYLDAKANKGVWLVRMEDLDPPREVTGAAQSILECLHAHGLKSDEKVQWQSQRHSYYQRALTQLLDQRDAFYCHCSRTDIQKAGNIHSGICQQVTDNGANNSDGVATRILVNNVSLEFNDGIQGQQIQQLNRETGDFVIKRKDGLFAYQMAVVVDDALQGITHIVRGSDLLDSTPRQIYLQQLLKLPALNYSHFPIITNEQQQKLSKQTFAKPLSFNSINENIIRALRFLQQPIANNASTMTNEELLASAIKNWSVKRIPRQLGIIEKTYD